MTGRYGVSPLEEVAETGVVEPVETTPVATRGRLPPPYFLKRFISAIIVALCQIYK